MKIQLLCVGPTSFKYLDEGVAIYTKRLKHYIPFDLIEIPYPKLGKKADENTIKKAEGQLILKEISNTDHLLLLDERGATKSSEDFAELLQKRMNSGTKKMVFVIGGAYGFSDEVYARANEKLSLSKMTFSHQMIRLFATEQIYRAFTILKGEPYHHS